MVQDHHDDCRRLGLNASASFGVNGSVSGQRLVSASSSDLLLMMSAWVDTHQRQEFENKLMGSSGAVFQSIALLPTSEAVSDHVPGTASLENSTVIEPRTKKARLIEKLCSKSFEQCVGRYLEKASSDANQTTAEVKKAVCRFKSITAPLTFSMTEQYCRTTQFVIEHARFFF